MAVCIWCVLFYIHVHVFVKRNVRKLLQKRYRNVPKYLIIYPINLIDILIQFIPILNLLFCLDLFLSVDDYTTYTYNYTCSYIDKFILPILEEMEKQWKQNNEDNES